MSRRGFTALELLVASALAVVVLAAILALLASGSRGTSAVAGRSEAMRAALTALEAIRADLERTLLTDPARDLALTASGLSFRVPRELSADPWSIAQVPVSFYLEPAGAASRLLRRTERGAAPVAGCLLRDLTARFQPGSTSTAYVELTVVGAGPTPAADYVARALVPVPLQVAPAGYVTGGPR